jgi:LPXTG-motif cell wall-anchored protein
VVPSTGDEVENLPPVIEEAPQSGALPQTGWVGTNLTVLLGLAMMAAGGLAIGFTRRSAKS